MSKTVPAHKAKLEQLSPADQQIIEYRSNWLIKARPKQVVLPGDGPNTLLWLAGRGFGKSRSLYEIGWWLTQLEPNTRIAAVAPTFGDLRRITFEGESGFQGLVPPLALQGGSWDSAYRSSTFELFFANGSVIQGFSSEAPERLRGPQFHFALCDELAAWVRAQETWNMLRFTLRLGASPKTFIATTPKPIKLLKGIISAKRTLTVRGSTFENKGNLSEDFLEDIEAQYAGTRLGRQELNAEILEDVEGALWSRDSIDQHRLDEAPCDMAALVIAVDPAGSIKGKGDEVGIVCAGRGTDNHGYVFADESRSGSPEEWASRVIRLYFAYQADAVVAETNYGGAMVKSTITQQARIMFQNGEIPTDHIPVRMVTATRGKVVRAEPVSTLYAAGLVHHIGRGLTALEDQMCNFTYQWDRNKDGSPDRMDALVWALSYLITTQKAVRTGRA